MEYVIGFLLAFIFGAVFTRIGPGWKYLGKPLDEMAGKIGAQPKPKKK